MSCISSLKYVFITMNKKPLNKTTPFLFTKTNYIILLISLLFLCAGLILMIGGGGENDFDFNKEIFSNQRIVYSPIIIIIGYIGMVFAIFYDE